MPITKSAKKALRGSAKKRVFNDRRRRALKRAEKKLAEVVLSDDSAATKTSLADAYQAVDKAAKRGVIKKNTAARKKSRLSRLAAKAGK